MCGGRVLMHQSSRLALANEQNRKLVADCPLLPHVPELYLYARIRSRFDQGSRIEVLPWDGMVSSLVTLCCIQDGGVPILNLSKMTDEEATHHRYRAILECSGCMAVHRY